MGEDVLLAVVLVAVVVLWWVVVRAWVNNDLRILTSDHKDYCTLPKTHRGPCQQAAHIGSSGGSDV